jgi:hypothetical protein
MTSARSCNSQAIFEPGKLIHGWESSPACAFIKRPERCTRASRDFKTVSANEYASMMEEAIEPENTIEIVNNWPY